MSSVYVSCPPLKLEEVKPIVSGRIEIYGNKVVDRWRNLEDAFYWDPVFARLLRRSGASSVTSPESPRTISPPPFESQEEVSDTIRQNECPYINPHHLKTKFPSAEDTLKVLLAESERIKELVSEAETKARKRLEAKSTLFAKKEPVLERTIAVEISKLLEINNGAQDEDNTGCLTAMDLETEAKKVSDSLRRGGQFSFDEDEEFQILEKACDIETFENISQSDQLGKLYSSAKPNLAISLQAPCSRPLRKIPSYIDLYDEELIDTNKVCYMQ